MIVTFVSQCQKKSLNITRQVLDSYANRIGDRTWQTVITQEGLNAVRARLSKTARKTTAVACHRIRGTSRTELVWIVGNRRRFDEFGVVPVNRTQRDLLKEKQENDWQFLPLIKVLIALAALFHDVGKSWDPFQKMLKQNNARDPVRHEWISLLLFRGMVAGKSDEQWLTELEGLKGKNKKDRKVFIKSLLREARPKRRNDDYPFEEDFSHLATWVAWLVVTHHKLPRMEQDSYLEVNRSLGSRDMLANISRQSGFDKECRELTANDWKFSEDLPLLSDRWCEVAARWVRKAKCVLSQIEDAVEVERSLLTYSRLALMLGDHYYSSQDKDSCWQSDLELYANTGKGDEGDRTLRQYLDEHLVHVTDSALKIGHLLPAFERELPKARDIRALRKPSPRKYSWQNRSVQMLSKWRKDNDFSSSGFFAVNMSSTGTGKTFANAKIMSALNGDSGLRYNLALGLRTLTLQTGDEYRNRLQLDSTELAVLIGSAATFYLHRERSGNESWLDQSEADSGSLSLQSLSEGLQIVHDSAIPEDKLSTILRDIKSRSLLYVPIVVSTIDHLIPATENVAGGRHILPFLRLMSADLVIDEVDDFNQLDMPAIARLVHLAGMLGRKVMISSATIPPSVAQGLFHAYHEGWKLFARSRQRRSGVTVFWVDEFGSALRNVVDERAFSTAHREFVGKRLKKLHGETQIKRKASILPLSRERVADSEERSRSFWFGKILQASIDLHRKHAILDVESGKLLSIGVIRVANVDPCIQLAAHLLQCELPKDFDIRVMAYHARQVLLIRSEQERHLDSVLNRKNGRKPQDNLLIRKHLNQTEKPNLAFILVATPVEEVGRDHDLDWAVIEPSSVRSIIQVSGRVVRHREINLEEPNLVLPEYNLKGFIGQEKYVFRYPGYESREHPLKHHSLYDLLNTESMAERVDASERIQCAENLLPDTRLADLEHHVLNEILVKADFGPATAKGWVHCAYYLTQLSQQVSRFRESRQDEIFKLHVTDEDGLELRFEDIEQGKPPEFLHIEELDESVRGRLWLALDYISLIDEHRRRLGYSTRRTCEYLGEIRLHTQEGERHFVFIPEFGFKNKTC